MATIPTATAVLPADSALESSDASQNEKLAGKPYSNVVPLDLPDPDAQLSDAERKAIVSYPAADCFTV